MLKLNSILLLTESHGPWADSAIRIFELLNKSITMLGISDKLNVYMYRNVDSLEEFIRKTDRQAACIVCHISAPMVSSFVRRYGSHFCWIFVSGGYIGLSGGSDDLLTQGRLICLSEAYGKEKNFPIWLKSWYDLGLDMSSFSQTSASLLTGQTVLGELCLELAGQLGFIIMILESHLMTLGFDVVTSEFSKPTRASQSEMDEWLTQMLNTCIDVRSLRVLCSKIDSVAKGERLSESANGESISLRMFETNLDSTVANLMSNSENESVSNPLDLLKELREALALTLQIMNKAAIESVRS